MSARGARPAAAGLAAAGLLSLAVALFFDALAGRGVLFQRDIHWMFYPHVESLVRIVAAGAWPLWDPHPTFGAPALADPGYALAYPPTWWNLVLPPAASYALFAFAHAAWAAVGLHALARSWGLRPLPAFVAAAAWMLSGPFVSFVNLFHHYAGLSWIPWVLVALERLLRRPTRGAALALGAAQAMQVLAGSGDMGLMGGLLVLGRVALWLVAARAAAAAVARTAGALALAGLAALLASAVQWLPTLAILRLGSRQALPTASNLYWSLHPAGLVDLVVPGLMADLPMSVALRAQLFESREPFLACLYLGLPAVTLAVLGLLAAPSRRAAALAAAVLVFLAFALGRHTPLYAWLTTLPPFGVMRYPVKHTAVVGLLTATLVGFGLQAWLAPWGRVARRRAHGLAILALLAALALSAAAVALRRPPASLAALLAPDAELLPQAARAALTAGVALVTSLLLARRARSPRPPPVLTAALVGLVLGDLGAVGGKVNALAPPELAAYRPAWIVPAMAAGVRRLYVVPFPAREERRLAAAPRGWSAEWWWTLGVQDVVAPPIGARWGLDGSYDGDFTGLGSPGVSVASQFLAWARSTPTGVKLLRMGSVDAVVSLTDEPGLGGEIARFQSVFEAPVRLHRVPDPLPRAYVVGGVRAPAEELAAYRLLRDRGFDPRREVILLTGAPRAPEAGLPGRAQVLERRADRLLIEAALDRAGHLVVTDAWSPGWRAHVDGRPAEVLRANLFFRAVALEAGRHVVEMRYRPPAALLGVVVSLLTWLALAGVAAHGMVRRGSKTRD